MRRRRAAKTPENTERWLVSYADFITLLFAFFVVMFAVSQADKTNAKAVSESIKKALANGGLAAAKPTSDAPDLAGAATALRDQLHDEVTAGSVGLTLDHRGLVISLEAGAFFPSGTADVSTAAYGAVGKVASVLNRLPNKIRLEGHTDSLPISNARFQSNWELSASRSIAMLRLLSDRFGVDSRRMVVVGYADNDAIDSNETETGRVRNRRVDVVVVNGA